MTHISPHERHIKPQEPVMPKPLHCTPRLQHPPPSRALLATGLLRHPLTEPDARALPILIDEHDAGGEKWGRFVHVDRTPQRCPISSSLPFDWSGQSPALAFTGARGLRSNDFRSNGR